MENNSQEVWRPIDGFEGLYEVSSLGRIRSLDRVGSNGNGIMLRKGRVLKLKKHKGGYLYVHLSKDNKQAAFKIHRLVGMAFPEICGQFREELQIDHRNCVRDDNRAINLHWVTRKENQNNPLTRQHQSNAKKAEKHPMWGKFGKDNPTSKPIIQFNLEGKFIAEFEGLSDAERKTGIRHQAICEVLKGRCKQTHGFIFRYKTA